MADFELSNARRVRSQLQRRGITDPRVLAAFHSVPREHFVPPELGEFAYEDTALPLAEGQTISQPYLVALTTQALELHGGEKVLEIGTGSGYAAAILSCIAGEVFSIERLPTMAQSAAERLGSAYNADQPEPKVGFHGLDLYSMFTSIDAVLHYLDDLDPSAAVVARERFGTLFETLRLLFGFYGAGSKGIVWEHNSHVGDAGATELAQRGEYNIGQLCRSAFGDLAYLIGQGTDHGTVIAAHDWNGALQRMTVCPSHPQSYERICHESGVPAFTLPLRAPSRASLREELMSARLERAIGVVYRPETERGSHYFDAVLPLQFDEYIWFDETSAVHPLGARSGRPGQGEMPDTYPFGL